MHMKCAGMSIYCISFNVYFESNLTISSNITFVLIRCWWVVVSLFQMRKAVSRHLYLSKDKTSLWTDYLYVFIYLISFISNLGTVWYKRGGISIKIRDVSIWHTAPCHRFVLRWPVAGKEWAWSVVWTRTPAQTRRRTVREVCPPIFWGTPVLITAPAGANEKHIGLRHWTESP